MRLLIILFIGLISIYFVQVKPSNKINQEFKRIVALSPAHTQLLKYVNLTDKIIATSIYDYEPLVQDRDKVSGGVIVEEEEILKLDPDLVFIGDIKGNDELINFLTSRNITYCILPTRSLQDISDSLKNIQKLFPKQVSETIVSDFQKKLDTIEKSTPNNSRNALMILSIDPVYALSTNDYLSEVYQKSGWKSVVHSQVPYPVLAEEDLFSLKNVDDILITEFLSNELPYISNIQQKLDAKNIIIITNHNIELPSPYLLETIKELRIKQSSL